MEVTFNEAEARLSEIVTAAQNGERVVITRDGEPAVELVRCREKCGSIDFDKLEADRRRLGIRGDEERWPEEFNDPAFSRHVLGLEEVTAHASRCVSTVSFRVRPKPGASLSVIAPSTGSTGSL